MRLIETLLLWEGMVENGRIRELLGVTSVHASRLIAAYRKAYPRQIERAEGAGRGVYYATKRITPQLTKGDPSEYLAQLGEHVSDRINTLRLDYSACPPRVYGAVHRACVRTTGLSIVYRSMATPDGTTRLIFPHTIIQIGHRWHTRAWDDATQMFRDFNIGRIAHVQSINSVSPCTPQDDAGWQTHVEVRIRAHQDLTSQQAAVVESEHFAGTAGRRIESRACLAKYLIQGMHIAIDPETQKPPQYTLQLRDLAEIESWLLPTDRND